MQALEELNHLKVLYDFFIIFAFQFGKKFFKHKPTCTSFMSNNYFGIRLFRLRLVSPTEVRLHFLCFAYRKSSKYDHVLFIENTNILSSGVFLVKYLGEKHKTSRTTTRLRDNQPMTNNTEFDNSFSSNH